MKREELKYMTQYVHAKKIILTDEVIEDGYLAIEDGKFNGITLEKPTDGNILDYSEDTIAPGLVDTHIHGYVGHDVMDNDFKGIQEISEALLACGVTSWLPTTLTAPTEQLNDVCQTIGDNYEDVAGAKIRGIFLEGPFFTEKYKGAQNLAYMSDPSIEKLKHWNDLSKDLVKKIAIAPERDGVKEFIKFANTIGVKTALAHSDASYEEAKEAVDAGANIFVHTYNAMSGLHHRNPGMVGAALGLDNVFAELISDGHHVHPGAAQVVVKARGPKETVLVTDCMRAGGLGDGESMLGELEVIVKDGQARLKDGGNLAGSILRLNESVRNMFEWGIVSQADALRMASYSPAKSVDIDDVCGQIKAGLDADFIIVGEDLELKATFLNGELKYKQ